VAGSLLRSYIVAENVSYTDRLVANVRRLLGVVADLWDMVGAEEVMVDRAGADELRLG